MSAGKKQKATAAQRIYGELVYWVTIFAAILCMIGPVVAMMDKDRNVLNPHYLFANIFNGEKPASVWALSATNPPKLDVWIGAEGRERLEHPGIDAKAAVEVLRTMPASEQPRYEMGVGGKAIAARLPEAEVSGEKAFLRIADGKVVTFEDARDAVLAVYGREVFTDGHFWMDDLTSGDGLTQFGLALGCSVALWALLGVAFAFLRQRVYLYVFLSLWVAALVFLSAAGLIESH